MQNNSRLLLCSRDLHKFMEANHISSVEKLFEISINELLMIPNFPYRLLPEWLSLRDRYNLLLEN